MASSFPNDPDGAMERAYREQQRPVTRSATPRENGAGILTPKAVLQATAVIIREEREANATIADALRKRIVKLEKRLEVLEAAQPRPALRAVAE